LAASWTDPPVLRQRIRAVRGTVREPFCVNLILAFDQRERLRVALDEGVEFVSFSWGVDGELIREAHEAGAGVLVQVGDAGAALGAVAAGADLLIVQGVEAGGHVQGSRRMLDLVREIRPAVGVPVIAAGGIGDAVAVSEACAAGADGFACGTLFLAAAEADVHPRYLDRLIEADAADTELTTLFDAGWPNAPHRVIRNRTVEAWLEAGCPASGSRPGEGEVVAVRSGAPIPRYSIAQPTRETTGDAGSMAMYAGTSVSGVTRSESAAEIAYRLLAALS
jgi:nitronate monooxygenase